MATPRKHWFYVADALGRETLSNDQLACAIRLMAHMNSRRSRDRLDHVAAARCVLRPGDLFEITGKGQLRSARGLLGGLAELFGISVRAREGLTSISWPKLPIYQGWVPETRADAGSHRARELPLPGSGAPEHQKREEKKSEEPASGGAPEGRSPLLNLLSKRPGSKREKELWLADNLDVIEIEADGDSKRLKTLVVRFYRHYVNAPPPEGLKLRKFAQAAARELTRQAADAQRAAWAADPELQRTNREVEAFLEKPATDDLFKGINFGRRKEH